MGLTRRRKTELRHPDPVKVQPATWDSWVKYCRTRGKEGVAIHEVRLKPHSVDASGLQLWIPTAVPLPEWFTAPPPPPAKGDGTGSHHRLPAAALALRRRLGWGNAGQVPAEPTVASKLSPEELARWKRIGRARAAGMSQNIMDPIGPQYPGLGSSLADQVHRYDETGRDGLGGSHEPPNSAGRIEYVESRRYRDNGGDRD